MEKFPEAYSLIKSKVDIYEPSKLSIEDILAAHTRDYLDSVNFDRSSGMPNGLTQYARNRLGLPANELLLARSMLETAGTVSATIDALNNRVAANLAGGTHHAFPNKGLGFCVLNDVAVAVEYLQARGRKPAQILIVDTDAHQGNANNAYFNRDASVFTYSIHVGKNYPAKKETGDCDVPLPRYVESAHYLRELERSLVPVFAQTEPDLVFWISGADPHSDDRFGQMLLTDQALAQRDHLVLQLCKAYATKLVLLYGGGYNKVAGKTGRLHAETVLRTHAYFNAD
jgi:acetoin utilization deacetylase AcuC-like enzyme